MKLNKPAFGLAVVSICLLVWLGVGYAIIPPAEPMSGTYVLNEREAAEKVVSDAIEEAIRGFGKGIKIARNRLRKKNYPPSPQITIAFASGQVAIDSAFGSVQTPLNGKTVKTVIDGKKTDVSTIAIGEKTLQRIYTNEDGERVNTYTLSGDGKTLTTHVTLRSPRLPRDCIYELKYTRK